MGLTEQIAEYVVNSGLEDFPPDGVHAAKGAILDCLGCMLAGHDEPLAEILEDFVRPASGQGVASVIGRGFKTSSADASLINGAMAHALDYDDITRAIKGPPDRRASSRRYGPGRRGGRFGARPAFGVYPGV